MSTDNQMWNWQSHSKEEWKESTHSSLQVHQTHILFYYNIKHSSTHQSHRHCKLGQLHKELEICEESKAQCLLTHCFMGIVCDKVRHGQTPHKLDGQSNQTKPHNTFTYRPVWLSRLYMANSLISSSRQWRIIPTLWCLMQYTDTNKHLHRHSRVIWLT